MCAMKTTLRTLQKRKQKSEKIACVSLYDASFARLANEAGMDVVLVGDSLGTCIQGHNTTIPVTIEDIHYHTRCVNNGNQNALLMADLPFMTYANINQALTNCASLMQAGAQMVKMEGGDWLTSTIKAVTDRGIPVSGHIGLTPQSVHQLGGYRIQGREQAQAQQLIDTAMRIQDAGASLIVLECIPMVLAAELTQMLTIPTIGIGAGPNCDGQVLILYDLLGLDTGKNLTFVKNFMVDAGGSAGEALSQYVKAVKQGDFPTYEHGFE